MTSGSRGAENTLSGDANTPGIRGSRRSLIILCCFFYALGGPKIGGPPPIEGIGDGPSARAPILRVLDAHQGHGTDGHRRGCRCRGSRKSEDGTGYKRADGANSEDGGSKDVSPNAHVLPPCVYRGHCLDPGSGGPDTNAVVRVFSFTSLWLIT